MNQAILLTGLRPEERECIGRRFAQSMRGTFTGALGVGVTGINLALPELVAFLTDVETELYGGEAKTDEPLSALMAAAINYHEIYLSFQRAGFSRAEALALIATVIQTGIMKGE